MAITRRQFVMGAAASALVLPFTSTAAALSLPTNYATEASANAFWSEPRTLTLHRPASGEKGTFCYWKDGSIYRPGYEDVCHLLRDVQANESKDMDIQLLNLLRGLTGWLDLSYGIRKPYEITSGYRSPHTNNKTENAAKNSLHLKGQAIDGRMEGIPVAYLGRLFAAFQTGGVGFYVNRARGFVHADTGRVRYWVD